MNMSHTITMRTTTTTTASAIIINTGYIRTWSGLLKLFETLIGTAVLGLVGYYGTHTAGGYKNMGFIGLSEETLMLLVSFACLLTTFLLFMSAMCSIMASSILPKTLFEFLYHLFAFVFYLSASLALLIIVSKHSDRYAKPYGYEGKMAAAVLGLINAVLYILSVFFSFRSYRTG